MRRYELMLLFRPDLEDDKLQSAVEKVTRAIVNAGGALTKVSPWGKRRLAYPIQHFREASYFLLQFDITPGQIRELERGLLISEEILRHLVTLLEDRGPAPDEELPAAVSATGERAADTADRQDGEPQPPEASGDEGAGPQPEGDAVEAPANEAAPDDGATDEAATDEGETDAETKAPSEPIEA